jgi:hypothetical protein
MKVSSGDRWSEDFLAGCAAYYLTSLLVLFGVLCGADFIHMGRIAAISSFPEFASACVHFDAGHYVQIVRAGYSYDPAQRSLVAFFPAYPLLGRLVSQTTGLPSEEAALLTAHAALLGAFVLLARYVRLRWPEATAGQRGVVLAVFGLWPMGLFFRMPYAESLFVCLTLAVLYGMARGWPLAVLAVLAGLGTAVRPVGVALTATFLWHVLSQSAFPLRVKARRALLLAPLACWGLLAYMAYQGLAFSMPLAFAQTQEHWSMSAPEDRSWPAKVCSLAMLEPIWGVYVPGYRREWAKVNPTGDPLFSMIFWNPILFILAAVLLVIGGWKRWLTGSELVLGACLLAIPYVTRSYEMSMASHGRFAAVVVVNYLVIGRTLSRFPPLIGTAYCVASALFLFIFTSLYVANYLVF